MKPLCTTCLRLCLLVETPAQTAAPVETKFQQFRRGGDPVKPWLKIKILPTKDTRIRGCLSSLFFLNHTLSPPPQTSPRLALSRSQGCIRWNPEPTNWEHTTQVFLKKGRSSPTGGSATSGSLNQLSGPLDQLSGSSFTLAPAATRNASHKTNVMVLVGPVRANSASHPRCNAHSPSTFTVFAKQSKKPV